MALDRSAGGGRARAGWVALALLAIGLLAAGPFLTRRAVGTSEAYNYSLSLADAVTQLRAGVVPPLVGQTPYAFNGRIHPLRNAPYLAALAGALDLASGRRLGFWELQNLSLALSLMGAAFACYFSVRWGAGGGRILSLGLAAAYAWCPALLAAAYASDLYMTVAAAPFLPLALGACLRQVRQPAVRHDLLLAGALAAAWLAHPPVALWLTGVAGLLRLAIFLRQPSGRALAGLGAGALLFAVLAGFGFVSAATATRGLTPLAPAGGFQQDYARVVLENLRDAFPAALLPVSRRVQDLGSFQLGYLAWLLLGSALVGLLRSRREGWDARRISVLALTAGALLLLVLCLPIPGLTHALWLRLPPAVHLLTNIWPMQRLYLVATAAIVLAAAATRADGIPRRAGALLLGAGLAWTLGQARPFLIQGYRQRWSAAETAASHRDSNIDLSAVSYAFFGLPDDYTSGVIDPWTQLRLVPLGASPAAVPETADLARAPIVQRGVLRRSSPESDQLEPELTLEPGRRYVLQLEFLTSPIRVYLKFSGEALARSYRLPDAGGPAGFGMAPEAGHDLVLWTALDHPEKVRASITPWGGGADDRPAAGFARFTLRAIDPARLPVRLESFVPLRCAVDAPRDGMALETFRQYLPGYTARVDDRTVAVLRSPAGRVLVPVPRGRSEVRVSYVGSPLLLASFWLSAVGWAGFIAGLAAAAFPAGRSGLAAAAGRARVGVVRHRISVTLGVAALALLAAGAAWRRRVRSASAPCCPWGRPAGTSPSWSWDTPPAARSSS